MTRGTNDAAAPENGTVGRGQWRALIAAHRSGSERGPRSRATSAIN